MSPVGIIALLGDGAFSLRNHMAGEKNGGGAGELITYSHFQHFRYPFQSKHDFPISLYKDNLLIQLHNYVRILNVK